MGRVEGGREDEEDDDGEKVASITATRRVARVTEADLITSRRRRKKETQDEMNAFGVKSYKFTIF